MKATKKIVGAAMALVAAVALSAGSTFAWFASNTSVTVTGMSVAANTTQEYLLAVSSESTTFSGGTITANSSSNITVDKSSETASSLYPAAYVNPGTTFANKSGSTDETISLTDTVVDSGYASYFAGGWTETHSAIKSLKETSATTSIYGPWYTARSNDSSQAAEDTTGAGRTYKQTESTSSSSLTEYVKVSTFYVGAVTGNKNGAQSVSNISVSVSIADKDTSGDTATDLSPVDIVLVFSNPMSGTSTYTMDNYVHCEVAASGSNYYVTQTRHVASSQTITYATGSSGSDIEGNYSSGVVAAETMILDELPAGSYFECDVYIYYDGTESSVTTNNKANISSASVTVTFTGDSAASKISQT